MAENAQGNHTNSDSSTNFPVVGVVASAGGLSAFKQFVGAIKTGCNMAFILVPHLDPTHESQMVPLLAKVCSIPVVKATQGLKVQENHVYVIPSGNFLKIAKGALELSEPPTPQGRQTAIDFFLRSLAVDQGERSIGIVLSGTGSHGTLGVREIKLAGGLAIAQRPSTAEYDQMPSSIIMAGLADYVLAPGEMPATLSRYASQPYVNPQAPSDVSVASAGAQLITILDLLRHSAQHDFSGYRKNMLLRRIQRRMGITHRDSLKSYIKLLDSDPKETIALCRDLLISVTAFFRDQEAYETLQATMTEEFKRRNTDSQPFRVWVPGCASGEEAYSLAMLLIESLEAAEADSNAYPVSDIAASKDPTATAPAADDSATGDATTETTSGPNPSGPNPSGNATSNTPPNATRNRIQIFASDVDDDAIAVARTGIYPASISADVSPERLERFFIRIDESHYQIGKQLRESIVFSRQNLITDPPFSKINLISCRNLLIYLEPQMQEKIISLFHFALSARGYLLLGPSESISRAEGLFDPISKKWRIFQRVPTNRRQTTSVPLITSIKSSTKDNSVKPTVHQRRSFKELVEKIIIEQFAPATALINLRYEVLYVTGPLVNYLEFPQGEPNQDLLAMSRPGLRTKLRMACKKATSQNAPVELIAQLKRGDDYFPCIINVRMVQRRHDSELFLLVSFQDKPKKDKSQENTQLDLDPETDAWPMVQQLEQELKSTSEDLHSAIEELEAANEDMKTSNEEIMSMNEELQSANEELETSKEELHALNEELSTVNLQLLEKVGDLDTANNDLENLMASTKIAMVFLDADLHIQRFTPPTLELLNLRTTDIGRPLRDIATRFLDDHLLDDCRQVMLSGQPIQREIEGENTRLYLRGVLPYRSQTGEIVGSVITFVDLTDRLALEKSLRESKGRLEAILSSAADSILTIDQHGTIDSANPATEELFGYQRDELLGEKILVIVPFGDLDKYLQSASKTKNPDEKNIRSQYQEFSAIRKDRSRVDVELTVNKINDVPLFSIIVRDLSQRKELQSRILEIASEEQRRIGQELHDGTQQELTGLSLLAGSLEEFIRNATPELGGDGSPTSSGASKFAKLNETAARIVKGLKEASQHVQALSHGIMPVQIDSEGLQSALEELAETTSVHGKLECEFTHSGNLQLKSNTVATQLFRIAQEAIHNAQRHGLASKIWIALSANSGEIQLEIRDNGVGFNVDDMRSHGRITHGAGLRIMEYRANTIGGCLSIESGGKSGAKNGTVVRCVVQTQGNIM